MTSIDRRKFMKLMAGGTAAVATGSLLSACGTETTAAEPGFKLPKDFYDVPMKGTARILHTTDWHGQLLPVYFREPNVNLGVGDAYGRPPHVVGKKLLKAMGIEKFTISSLADETIPETSILAEEMLTVWPVSEAFIDGVETGMTIRDSLPNLIIRYSDLYPLSWTYVQIYKGAPQLGKSGAIFNTTPRWHNTIVPQSEVLSIENWESMIGTDGQYTIEVVTITPFNNWQPERLSHVSFNIDRNVNVNGQVVTSEK